MKKTHAAVTDGGSALRSYQDVVVGSRSLFFLIYFELCMLLSVVPGAVGFVLRKIFWPRLFYSCGKGVNFGSNIILRHPGKIRIGNKVILSEGCLLDGRGEDNNISITLADEVILSNNVIISCKNGTITMGTRTGLNSRVTIQSTNNCPVAIGEDVIIGQGSFVVGGGNYNTDRHDVPIREQGIKNDGGVRVLDNVWLGANVTVLGGVTIESGSIVGAGSVVSKTIPAGVVCFGVPARVMKKR